MRLYATRRPSGETSGALRKSVRLAAKSSGVTSGRSKSPFWLRSQISSRPLRSVVNAIAVNDGDHVGSISLREVASTTDGDG